MVNFNGTIEIKSMKHNTYISNDPLVLWIKTEFDDKLNGVINKNFVLCYLDDDVIGIYDQNGLTAVVVVKHVEKLPESLVRDRLEGLNIEGIHLDSLNFYAETNGCQMVYTRDFKLMHHYEFHQAVIHITTALTRYRIETVEIIIAKYDDLNKKGFNDYNITIDLGEITMFEKKRLEWKSEMLAFSFSPYPDDNNPWNTYLGPRFTDVNGNTFPSFKDISTDMIDYWEKRMHGTHNPILISRYAELVWDFKEKVCGTRPSGKVIDTLIDSLIRCAEGYYPEHAISGLQMLDRAFKLAKMAKKSVLFGRIKNAYSDYDNHYYNEEHIGVWQYYYDFMMNNISLFNKTEQESIVNRLRIALKRQAGKKPDGQGNDRLNPWLVSQMASLLCDYYIKIGNSNRIQDLLNIAEESFKQAGTSNPGLAAVGGYDQMHRIYQHYGMKDKAADMIRLMQQEGQNVLDSLQEHKVELDYPQEEIKKAEQLLTQGADDEIWQKMLFYFMPEKAETEKQVKERAKTSPLTFLVQTQLLDYKGRTKSVVSSIENDIEGHVVLQYCRILDIQAPMLHHIIQVNINNGVLTANKLYDYLSDSPIIDADRLPILRRGIDAYFSNDHMISLSLLIPQIEESIRNMIEQCGGTTLRPQKGGKGFQVRTFDDILRDPIVDQCFMKEVSFYLRVLFTDQRGWNMRNDICHGLAQSSSFNFKTADRVLMVLLLIGMIRWKV